MEDDGLAVPRPVLPPSAEEVKMVQEMHARLKPLSPERLEQLRLMGKQSTEEKPDLLIERDRQEIARMEKELNESL